VVEAAYDIAINFLAGVTEKLPELIQGGVDFIEAFLEGIGEAIPDVVDAAFQMVIDVIGGIADSIETNTPLILEACEDLATAFIDGLKNYLNIDQGDTIAGNLIDGLIQGINNGVTWVVDAVKELGRKVLAGLTNIFKEQSPSQETEWMGENLDKGLINGIVGLAGKVVKAAEDLGSDAINGIRSTISQISDVIDSDMDANPVITPILNLDQIRSGANTLGGILGNGQSYNLAASQITADRVIAETNQNGSNQGLNNGQMVTNQFNLNGVTVRSEADINKIAEKLYRLQEQAMRARGIKPAYTT
jgi:phage-related protein